MPPPSRNAVVRKNVAGTPALCKSGATIIIYLTEPIVEGQVNAGPWQRALSVQCIDNVAQRYRFKVSGEEFQIRLKLCDGSEPVEIAYVGGTYSSLTMW
jgi:hypothetical protein